ncbi:MAG: hypothetical protein LBQ01_10075, partial [Prevotellaceae bacterium]|nr:hypothetical protein [Prevotellaceae bacterium]
AKRIAFPEKPVKSLSDYHIVTNIYARKDTNIPVKRQDNTLNTLICSCEPEIFLDSSGCVVYDKIPFF